MSNNLAATAELRYRSTIELRSSRTLSLSLSLSLSALLVKLRSGSKERTTVGRVDNAFNGRERVD